MDQNPTAIEYANARRQVRATEEVIRDGVRLRLPPMPLSHRWFWAVLVAGAVWCVPGAVLGADWVLHDRTPIGLRERGAILVGTFFFGTVGLGLFETVCARWTEIEARGGRIVLRCHGFPRRKRRREWEVGRVADVVFLPRWGIRLLDPRDRALYTISEGLAADQDWVATRLGELVRQMRQQLGGRLTPSDDDMARGSG